MSIGTFGPVTFEVSAEKTRTFDDFNRKTAAKFEEHAIIGQKAKLEFISPGLDEISFHVIFSAFHGLNPLEEVKQIREIVQTGEYHPLLIGGKVVGIFIIDALSEAWRHVDNRGLVLYIAVDLTMKEYVLDEEETRRIIEDAEAQAAKEAQTIAAVQEQAQQTGLSIEEIGNLASLAVNGVRDAALAIPAVQSILAATQRQQEGEIYSSLGLNLASLAVQSRTDPYGAITGTLDQLANYAVDKPSVAKIIYGAKAAGSVLQIAQQLKR